MLRFAREFLHPFTLPFLIALLLLVDLWWRRRESRGRLLALTGVWAVLTVFCTPAVAFLAMGTLEWPHGPTPPATWDDAGAVVVLGGGVHEADDVIPEARLTDQTRDRCLAALRVYRRIGPVPVVVTGGKKVRSTPGPAVGDVMRAFLVELGVPPEDIVVESRSRTTYENATLTRPLLEDRGVRRIVLVTEASHLKRSILCFRAQGFEVIPVGADYRATGFRWGIERFLPRPSAAQDWQRVLHEWLGIAWYKVRGWI